MKDKNGKKIKIGDFVIIDGVYIEQILGKIIYYEGNNWATVLINAGEISLPTANLIRATNELLITFILKGELDETSKLSKFKNW